MHDLMVALGRRGVKSSAVVHRHQWSIRSSRETWSAAGQDFQIVRAGRWAEVLYTPISPAFPWHLRREIKLLRPDALHIHMPNLSAFWALVMPAARRIPWLVHWHGDVITDAQGGLMKLAYMLYRPFEQAMLKRARSVVVTSLPYLKSSEPLQRWKTKCHVVPLGLDVERFTVKNPPTVEPATPGQELPLRVLYVGRLTYYKGVKYLLEAAARLENIRLDLVGQGEQAEALRTLASSLGLEDRVTFHGSPDDNGLAQLMVRCDCLCLPSIERTEAFGLVLLEAMYFGKATVISDVAGSGMGWIVDNGITGIKVKPADARALANALDQLASNREELADMGRQGKQKFEKMFEINQASDGIWELYQLLNPVKAKRINQTAP